VKVEPVRTVPPRQLAPLDLKYRTLSYLGLMVLVPVLAFFRPLFSMREAVV
jgi:hypothetical protein